MSRFIQLHLLTFYPPSNLNRDDTGRPKTATIGGRPRLRISSQALKRAWRTSAIFETQLAAHLAKRTQRLGEEIQKYLLGKGAKPDMALKAARDVAEHFGKLKDAKDDNPARTQQLAFIGPEEWTTAFAYAEQIAGGEKLELKPDMLLRRADTAADLAMFGRMLADNPDYNREAAVQVAHATTTHSVTVEDDYYTAMDDLKTSAEDAGAGFIGELGFGSGLFYLYICIDTALLKHNLDGDADLAATAAMALAEAAATVSPKGKQASFAALSRAQFVLAEAADTQPRTLAGAFMRAVTGEDLAATSVGALLDWRANLAKAYNEALPASTMLNVTAGEGSLADVTGFIRKHIHE
jgi:CRISPR system Cascade subunit CasC